MFDHLLSVISSDFQLATSKHLVLFVARKLVLCDLGFALLLLDYAMTDSVHPLILKVFPRLVLQL